MSTKIVNDLLRELGPKEVVTISPKDSVMDAAISMVVNRVGALVVVDDEGAVVGIISERDIVIKLVASRLDADMNKVEEIMTENVRTVSRQTNLKECEDIMKELHIRHLPVMDNGKLIAVVSIRDLLVSTRAEQEELVRLIRDYTGL